MTAPAQHATQQKTLTVSEVFGPTVQGEGPSLGRRCAFVRLGGCNLHCSWCDTPYTWDASRYDLRAELRREPIADLVATVAGMNVSLCVLTGGEPLLQQRQPAFVSFLGLLAASRVQVEVETNGTIAPTPVVAELVARFNVSPKLSSGGDHEDRRILPPTLNRFRQLALDGKAAFKIVVGSIEDLAELDRLVSTHALPREHVYVMPEGVTAEAVDGHLRAVADAAIQRGYNLTTRLHVLTWGTERGR